MLHECSASDRAAYDLLWPGFARQLGRTMCGLASVAIVARALGRSRGGGREWSEDGVLAMQLAVSSEEVVRRGLTLDEMGEVRMQQMLYYSEVCARARRSCDVASLSTRWGGGETTCSSQ